MRIDDNTRICAIRGMEILRKGTLIRYNSIAGYGEVLWDGLQHTIRVCPTLYASRGIKFKRLKEINK